MRRSPKHGIESRKTAISPTITPDRPVRSKPLWHTGFLNSGQITLVRLVPDEEDWNFGGRLRVEDTLKFSLKMGTLGCEVCQVGLV